MASKRSSSLKSANIITGALYVLIGVLFIIFRAGVLHVLLTVIGALFILAGAAQIIADKEYLAGAIMVVIGVVLIIGSWTFLSVVLIVFGVLYILMGLSNLVKALQKKRKNGFALLSALMAIALGVLLIVLNMNLLDWICVVVGIIFIVQGVFTALALHK